MVCPTSPAAHLFSHGSAVETHGQASAFSDWGAILEKMGESPVRKLTTFVPISSAHISSPTTYSGTCAAASLNSKIHGIKIPAIHHQPVGVDPRMYVSFWLTTTMVHKSSTVI